MAAANNDSNSEPAAKQMKIDSEALSELFACIICLAPSPKPFTQVCKGYLFYFKKSVYCSSINA